MPKQLRRKPLPFTVDEYFSQNAGLPEKVELLRGEIGPYSDAGKLTMLAILGG